MMTKEASNFTVSLCEYVQSNYCIRNGWISFAFSLYIYILFKLSPFVHANSETHRVLILNSIILGLCIHSRFSGWLIDWCLTPTWVVFQLYCGINALDLAGKVVTFCRHHAIRKLFLPGTSSNNFKKKIPVFSYCFNWNASFSRKCQFLILIWQRFALNP